MAGLVGCVMSHIASMLAASSSIITFDIYQHYFRRATEGPGLVRLGRIATTIVGSEGLDSAPV